MVILALLIYILFTISKGAINLVIGTILNIVSLIFLWNLFSFLKQQIDYNYVDFDEKISKYWNFVFSALSIHLGMLIFSRVLYSLSSIICLKIGIPLIHVKLLYDFVSNKSGLVSRKGKALLIGTIGCCFGMFLLC